MPVNHLVLASGAAVAVSVAVATAMAMYENPELRRYADDIRRRVAMALHSLGDEINPPNRPPRFNRPEDAEGFMQSSRGAGAEPGVDADEETRRRQREELLYWNSVLLRKRGGETAEQPAALPADAEPSHPRTGTGTDSRDASFDDFLRQDENIGQGTYVFNTGADVRDASCMGLRHRGFAASTLYTNPFADEHHLDSEEVADMLAIYTPRQEEHMSDIYSATTPEHEDIQSRTIDGSPALMEPSSPQLPLPPTLERHLARDEFMTASQEDQHEAYASIQAWAQHSSHNFYAPLPGTPAAPVSEPDPEPLSDGQLTPTDSLSVIGISEADVPWSTTPAKDQRPLDVMSESEGVFTPASWSDVGSVVSETDGQARANAPLNV